MAGAVGILFAFGYFFSERWAVPVILRAQLFRASRLLLVLVFVHIAFSIASSLRMGWMSFQKGEVEGEATPKLSRPSAVLEIIAAIRQLSPAYRTVFNLFVIEGLTHEEIASHLGISVGSSKSNLSKARENLRKILTKKTDHKAYVESLR